VDQKRFETIARTVISLPSRRGVLRVLAGAGLSVGTLGLSGIAESKRKRTSKKKVKRNKQKRRGQGLPPEPGTEPPSLPPSPGPVLTYQCPGPKHDDVSGDGAVRFAQTFIAERSGSLRQIQFSRGSGCRGGHQQ
jgi:hypothetical protein